MPNKYIKTEEKGMSDKFLCIYTDLCWLSQTFVEFVNKSKNTESISLKVSQVLVPFIKNADPD